VPWPATAPRWTTERNWFQILPALLPRHTFNFYKTTEWLYLAVADEAFGRQARAVACAGVAQRATDGVRRAFFTARML
jgi:hypothetical protein